ncbi:hypothetical protein NSQ20_11605 [Paenibacillus sp. FSL K6-1122]|uniref:hypothetical protein n=1 Tax=Paenibacillus sp. FSL K6-1122 TaxID=2954512 RepID=UPI0030EE6FF0
MNREWVKKITDNHNGLVDSSYFELSSFHDFLSQYSQQSAVIDVNLKDLYLWLRNPLQHRKNLIKLSRYYYNKEGIVTDIYDLFKTLPVLNYSVNLNNEAMAFKKNKTQINGFIKKINVKKLARDTLFTQIVEGVCVWYNRGNKYIQFLETDQICIEYMVNGRWQVLYDLEYLSSYKLNEGLAQQINAAPDEVTTRKYLDYKAGKSERYVPLDIHKTQVFKLRGSRNEPYSIPYCIPAVASILHRDLLEKTEKALADRVTNQIIIQKIGTIPSQDGKTQLPVSKDATQGYHNNLKNLVQKKHDHHSPDSSSTAPLTVPSFINIEELKVNMNTFPKEVWERIERDIYKKLGYSMSLNMGGANGQSFGSSSINVEKIYSTIFYMLEDIEEALNFYMEQIATNDNLNPSIRFSRATILDKETGFKQAESLYLKGRGSLKDYVESAGYNFDHWLAQVRYENEVLKLDELPVHATSFTQSGDGSSSGRKSENKSTDESDKNNNSNANESPFPSNT